MGPFIFLDVETTGFDPQKNRIIEFACIRWQDGKELDRYETLVNPHTPIPQDVIHLTGITDADVATAPSFTNVKEKIAAFIGDDPVVGHNIPFDVGFLKSHHVPLEKNALIDTVILARILLPKEESYALEVLMRRHKIPLRASHRAMADTETTMDFFGFLLGKIAAVPEEVLMDLRAHLTKSTWAAKSIFLDAKGAAGADISPATTTTPPSGVSPTKMPSAWWLPSTIEKVLDTPYSIIESRRNIPFDSFEKEKLVVGYATPSHAQRLHKQARAAGRTCALLKEPSWYISEKKFAELCDAPTWPNEDTPFLIKLFLWQHHTKTGDRDELVFDREDYHKFDRVADTEGTGTFWEKALATALESDVIFVKHHALAKGIGEKLKDAKKRLLLVTEASQLEDTFTAALSHKYTDSQLRTVFGDKGLMVTGLLWMAYKRLISADAFPGEALLIDENSRMGLEWQRVCDCVQNLPEDALKRALLEDLELSENRLLYLSPFFEEMNVVSAPVDLRSAFVESTAVFKKIVLTSPALSGEGSFALVKHILGLDQTWLTIQEPSLMEDPKVTPRLPARSHASAKAGTTLTVPADFPSPSSDGYFKRCLKLFTELMLAEKGRCLFILSSKKSVEAFYRALSSVGRTNGVNVIGVGVSGGAGKAISMFKNDPDHSILLAAATIAPQLHQLKEHVDTFVFQKIPFDHAESIVHSKRGLFFDDPFTQYTLPRAIMKFRELLFEIGVTMPLAENEDQKACYVLDSRLVNQDYGKLFL